MKAYTHLKIPIALTVILIALCFLLSSEAVSETRDKPLPRLGVWITVFSPEKVLYTEENADKLIETCQFAGIKDIYLQVYRADKAYYDSKITDASAYERMLASSGGRDMIEYLLSRTEETGIKVHAWLNMLSIAHNEDANIVKKFGKSVLTIDQYGRTPLRKNDRDELDKYYIRENQLFLEPGDPRVREYISSIVGEVAGRYPGLDGIHMDYIRYPSAVPSIPGSRFSSHGISYGYGEKNLEAFKDSTGLDPRTMKPLRSNYYKWDEWRRDRVSLLVKKAAEAAESSSPGIQVSCTIVPSVDRTYLDTFQDWTTWLKERTADNIILMNYTDDTRYMVLRSEAMSLPGLEDRVMTGLGAYLLKDDLPTLKDQITKIKGTDTPGIVLFSYDEVASNEELRGFLRKHFFVEGY
ncbi:MAG: family 10 glycosylhydrolase [Candidatus Omnitrophica bacterium]|nr:family 10 glycosylhydrolase [Candidatus Omnitrophota bacterium]